VLNLGNERSLVELGTFPEIAYARDLQAPLEWDMGWTLPKSLAVEGPSRRKGALFSAEALGFSGSIAWWDNVEGLGRAVVNRMAYRFAGSEFGMQPVAAGKSEYDLVENRPDFKFRRTPDRPWKLPPPAKCYGFPDQVRACFQNAGFLSDFELQFEELFGQMYYLGPLCGFRANPATGSTGNLPPIPREGCH